MITQRLPAILLSTSLCASFVLAQPVAEDVVLAPYQTRYLGDELGRENQYRYTMYMMLTNFVSADAQTPGEIARQLANELGREFSEVQRLFGQISAADAQHHARASKTARSLCRYDITSGEEWAAVMESIRRDRERSMDVFLSSVEERIAPELWSRLVKRAESRHQALSMVRNDFSEMAQHIDWREYLNIRCN